MKRLLHNLFLPLLAAVLCSGACSDDDNGKRPKPSGYDIYTAGYKTPSGKSVATVWKNGNELYALTDGTNNAWAYSVSVDNGTVYTAGYEQQGDAIVGRIWVNGTLKYTVAPASGSAYLYSVSAAGGSIYVAGSEDTDGRPDGQNLEGRRGDARLFGEPRHIAGPGRGRLGKRCLCPRAASRAASKNSSPWSGRTTRLHFTLTDRTDRRRSHRPLRRRPHALHGGLCGHTGRRLERRRPALHADRRLLLGRGHRRLPFGECALRRRLHRRRLRERGRRLEERPGALRPLGRPAQGSLPYAIAAYGDDVFSAGTLFGTSRTAVVWHGEEILHTLTDGTGHGKAYSMSVVPLYR